jgi:Nickel responsive protein SCO4226-like
MKKFIIERELHGIGKLTSEEIRSIAQKSCNVINNLEEPYHWIQTFVTDNKLYCVHIAPDRETVLEHARQGGFPADNIAEVRNTIDPTTSA